MLDLAWRQLLLLQQQLDKALLVNRFTLLVERCCLLSISTDEVLVERCGLGPSCRQVYFAC